MSEKQYEVVEVKGKQVKVSRLCCDCSHFRMWKPEERYCTVEKDVVNPLAAGCDKFKRRKGLNYLDFDKGKLEVFKIE